ncbi:replication initiation and membrane attachment family protein [Pseudalkalibacillus decolorationis]|uniref:replication initiation and membrane attachment family protein n=1 Tax=Pseudalkalibacillus decolorationis TaxID=163879 RepID=UPI002149111F|nr:DnaD domain protein [Pseudalkalibacillus decolorationis]
MENHWKELLPVDRYTVFSNGIIRPDDLRVVTMLYQPLIGANAYSVFMTLFSELDSKEIESKPSSHHSLMSHTQMNLQSIYEARKKLEAIGLLKTFQKKTDDERVFIYEIQPALDPEQFFQDDVLSIYLYGRLGKQRYIEIKRRFTYTHPEIPDYQDVTANFNDVFTSLHASEMRSGSQSDIHNTSNEKDTKYRKHYNGTSPEFSGEDFDFETLVRDLSSFIIPSEVLTEDLKEAILRIAFIYKISPLDMSSIVQQAYFKDEELTAEKLRRETRRWYKIEKPGQQPTLSDRNQASSITSTESSAQQTPEEMMVRTFEMISPRVLLEKYSEGGRAAASDLKLVESIMFEQRLPSGVVNVLIDYVLNTNDMKLIHSHVEKIASQWKRKKISTVRGAMAVAKAEHQNYQTYKQQKNKPTGYRQQRRNDVRKDTLPKWMTSSKGESSSKKDEPVSENEKKWLEEYLKGL